MKIFSFNTQNLKCCVKGYVRYKTSLSKRQLYTKNTEATFIYVPSPKCNIIFVCMLKFLEMLKKGLWNVENLVVNLIRHLIS